MVTLSSCTCFILVISSVVSSAPCRDPLTAPFNSSSIWYQPLGSSAIYSPARLFVNVTPQQGVFSDDDWFITTHQNDPVIPWYSQGHWNSTPNCLQFPWAPFVQSIHWPENYTIVQSGNNALALLQPDGDSLIFTQPAYRCSTSSPLLSLHDVYRGTGSIRGAGNWGGHGGSGLNAIGGTLRLGELTKSSPLPGPQHVLKLQLWAKPYYYGVKAGANWSTCFRWPALQCDGYADDPSLYGGDDPLLTPGALLAINPSHLPVILKTLNSVPAKQLAWTLTYFGGLLCDDTYEDRMTFNTEHGFTSQFEQEWGFPFTTWEGDNRPGAKVWLEDVLTLFRALEVVANNEKDTPGGGGDTLTPHPPPLCPQTPF